MKASPPDDVRQMYEETADSYAEMMDDEIRLPVYADVLGRLSRRLTDLQGFLVDTACGSGHMLSMYSSCYDRHRSLLGVDLSPRMVAIAKDVLGDKGHVVVGDMRDLSEVEDGAAAAVLNFFALHHLDSDGVQVALREWHRVLSPGGQFVIATWEGAGAVDYGDESDIVALRYSRQELRRWVESADFELSRCVVEPVEGMPMDAVFVEGERR